MLLLLFDLVQPRHRHHQGQAEINVTVMILSFPTDMPGQTVQTQIRLLLGAVWSGSALFAQAYLSENLVSLQCRPWSDCSSRSSLIWVCTVCHFICIVWTHYSMVEPHSSNFRVITTNFLVVWMIKEFMVKPDITGDTNLSWILFA